ncbi:MAG: PH domain-containing protein [Parcubacteria group bacterium]
MRYDILDLDPNEHVIMEVRKHWIVFTGYLLATFISGLFPLVLFTSAEIFFPKAFNFNIEGNIFALFSFAYFIWLLFLWISFFIYWTKFYLDVWYVTDKRIIMVDQKYLFHREISNVRFDKIQDVSITVPGFLSTLLDFGNINVQTASDNVCEFNMSVIRHPGKVREVIFSKHNEVSDKALNIPNPSGV